RTIGWYDLNHENFNTPIYKQDIKNYNLISEELLLIAIYPKNRQSLEEFIMSKGFVMGKTAWYL
ncbi:hypothetical protein OAU25_03275, partial [Crocinitomicaceae bacterium]|nr:hypothetical protein [Crocinitomicaceae bacterium]